MNNKYNVIRIASRYQRVNKKRQMDNGQKKVKGEEMTNKSLHRKLEIE
jgi:hypothetical protein